MSGSGSLAWSAPEGDREGRASAGSQELGEGDRGRWHKAKTHSTFLTKGRKNSFSFSSSSSSPSPSSCPPPPGGGSMLPGYQVSAAALGTS